ncbi:diaminobutyrate acetyltransferase [Isoptericola chiayiensis]|uniref:L-2,4-diaminobutyric acid acetyltransferase n=2 Tax=Isoptericola chiayiensis TaxID=579446 RepID=A0ABP8Y377_9MICO
MVFRGMNTTESSSSDHQVPGGATPGRDSVDLQIRPPALADGGEMWRVARDSGSLDLNSSYSYLLLADHFSDTCRVAVLDGRVVGFLSGYLLPRDPSRFFLWQVAVDDAARGHRVAGRLVDSVIDGLPGVDSLVTTVTEDNTSSRRVFQRWAAERGATLSEVTGFEAEHFPDGHEAEPLLVIEGIRRS